MANERLEYDSLKTVLLYLDPNLRIQLNLQIPSIRSAEKAVPLKINHLISGDHKIIINDTTYRLGVYRHYQNPDEIPRYHQIQNDDGGIGYDLDQFGFRTYPSEDWMTPGDIDLRAFRLGMNENHPVAEARWKECLIIYKEAWRRLGSPGPPLGYIIPELREFPRPDEVNAANENAFIWAMRRPVEFIKLNIEEHRALLLPFHYHRINSPAPFTPYIQLTIEGPRGKTIERMTCSRRLCEAMKYLNTLIFGARRIPVRVNQLSFAALSYAHRFPADLRIRARELQSDCANFDNLGDLVDSTSFPLDTLTIQLLLENTEFLSQNIVRSSRKLIISNHHNCDEDWTPFLQNFQHPNIVLKFQNTFRDLDYINFINNWLRTGRPAETTLAFGFRSLDLVMNQLEIISGRVEVIERNERSLTLPMENGSRLMICCEQFEQDPNETETRKQIRFNRIEERYKCDWSLKMIVL